MLAPIISSLDEIYCIFLFRTHASGLFQLNSPPAVLCFLASAFIIMFGIALPLTLVLLHAATRLRKTSRKKKKWEKKTNMNVSTAATVTPVISTQTVSHVSSLKQASAGGKAPPKRTKKNKRKKKNSNQKKGNIPATSSGTITSESSDEIAEEVAENSEADWKLEASLEMDDARYSHQPSAEELGKAISSPRLDLAVESEKAPSFSLITDVVGLDCEMVGVGRKGLVSILARVSIVNQYGHPIYDEFVKPTKKVI